MVAPSVDPLGDYRAHSRWTDAGRWAARLDDLPGDPAGLCRVVQGLVVHYGPLDAAATAALDEAARLSADGVAPAALRALTAGHPGLAVPPVIRSLSPAAGARQVVLGQEAP